MAQSTPETVSADEAVSNLIEETTDRNPEQVIQTVIASLDHDQTAMVNHSNGSYLWKFKYGTVEVFVQLTGSGDDDTLTVWASVLKLPAKDEARLTRHLLEMNWASTLEARFAILNQEVVVVSTRSLADLSPGEISRAITIVATLSDDNDEPLQAQFGK
ncbi:YbjN domain-containing protein [Kovacikia minuta CCNUW1]|uniref:YbjN domain-containing protein n=1 Tax=Kovacikia minuta TaxID=2931930 RepID=UPI001CCD9497|nr:YbjN domain-containing protein [Kovacikia minuta]UBF29181.1 YbjN domain-containing protein [Kovacikia minuta CCNUW1]